jgi:hypothetical protein
MKLRYQLGSIFLVLAFGVLVIFLTGCGNLNQGSDEYGQETFSTYSACAKGILCETDTQLECFPEEDFYDNGDGMVCLKPGTFVDSFTKRKIIKTNRSPASTPASK